MIPTLRRLGCISLVLAAAACGGNKRAPETPTPPSGPTFGKSDTTLRAGFRAIEAQTGGRLGVAAIDLNSGWRTSYRGDETFPMASVGKLPMAIAFLRRVDSGAYRLDSVVQLNAADHGPGGSLLFKRALHTDGRATLHELLEAMLVYSDNSACDYILRLAGGPKAVDALMRSIGLRHIDVTHSERDLVLRWAGVEAKSSDSAWTRGRIYAAIAAAGDSGCRRAEQKLVNDPADAAPPKEAAMLLEMIEHGSLLGAATNDTLLAIMSRAATGRGRLMALLPEGTPIAHKTGTIGTTTNDIGIVTLPAGRGRLAIAVFVKGAPADIKTREHAIARAAQLVYNRLAGPP